eukprot:TRINITY_DN55656_c0_g1_i2.p1 TRINITY_DN55656_c0_g1~~TRINITY_DN55656_c0_g1_i2.p1  ORF type:complete len:133 (-),score=5.60 TRINITY_DN55656_c0_g1_i2:311-709(-)
MRVWDTRKNSCSKVHTMWLWRCIPPAVGRKKKLDCIFDSPNQLLYFYLTDEMADKASSVPPTAPPEPNSLPYCTKHNNQQVFALCTEDGQLVHVHRDYNRWQHHQHSHACLDVASTFGRLCEDLIRPRFSTC